MEFEDYVKRLEEISKYIVVEKKDYNEVMLGDVRPRDGLEEMISLDGDTKKMYRIPADLKKEPFNELDLRGRFLVGIKNFERNVYTVKLEVSRDLETNDTNYSTSLEFYVQIPDKTITKVVKNKYKDLDLIFGTRDGKPHIFFPIGRGSLDDADRVAKTLLHEV